MADLDVFKVDVDTPQAGGRRGEAARAAFIKHNEMIDALKGMVDYVGNEAPAAPVPYAQWIDTSVNPAMLRRRNASNTAWVAIGPALTVFGNAAEQTIITAPFDQAANRVVVARGAGSVGWMGLGGLSIQASWSDVEESPANFFAAAVEPGNPAPHGQYSHMLKLNRHTGAWTILTLPYGTGARPHRVGVKSRYDAATQFDQVIYSSLDNAPYQSETSAEWPNTVVLPGGGIHRAAPSLMAGMFNTDTCTVVSNANGVSYRHPDGWQMCTIENCAGGAWIDVPEGSVWRSVGQSWAFPQPFISRPSVAFNCSTQNSAGAWVGGGAYDNYSTAAYFTAWCGYQVAQSIEISGQAVGRWKV